jgi:hypothetical protein
VTPYAIEPFDPDKHDRTSFSCGVDQVDSYFKRTANKLAGAGNTRLYVMVGADDVVVGFYALNAHAVDYTALPPRYARTRPRHGAIPAAYISMIGVDQRYSGNGHGGVLLVDALTRITRAADEIGIAVVMLDILDCGNLDLVARRKNLHSSYGFTPLPSNNLRMFLPIGTIRTLFDE